MFKAIIKDIKRDEFQASNTPFLNVEVEIQNEQGEAVETKKFGYPATTSAADIKADIAKVLQAYGSDLILAEQTKVADEINTQAEQTAQDLLGASIDQPSA